MEPVNVLYRRRVLLLVPQDQVANSQADGQFLKHNRCCDPVLDKVAILTGLYDIILLDAQWFDLLDDVPLAEQEPA